jgi:hypothetical protein
MIATILVIFTISLLVSICAIMGIKIVVMSNEMAELNLRVALSEQQIKNQFNNSGPIEQSEGFLKFVSQSRDWAFQYIEEVQLGLKNFVDEVEPSLMYFDAYGNAGPLGPNYDALQKISAEFIKLKQLLPKEE